MDKYPGTRGPTDTVPRPSTGLEVRRLRTQPSSAADLPGALDKVLPLSGPQFSHLQNGFNKTSLTGCFENEMRS